MADIKTKGSPAGTTPTGPRTPFTSLVVLLMSFVVAGATVALFMAMGTRVMASLAIGGAVLLVALGLTVAVDVRSRMHKED